MKSILLMALLAVAACGSPTSETVRPPALTVMASMVAVRNAASYGNQTGYCTYTFRIVASVAGVAINYDVIARADAGAIFGSAPRHQTGLFVDSLVRAWTVADTQLSGANDLTVTYILAGPDLSKQGFRGAGCPPA